jgi:hypothetical protein
MRLWAVAEEMDWARLSGAQKTAQYDAWAKDAEVGGLLGRYMDQREVRVYIKDTVMKGYGRRRLADPQKILRILGVSEDISTAKRFERPHGRRLPDGRVICWGNAADWKAVLTAIHERTYLERPTSRPGQAVLLAANGRFADHQFREMVEDAAKKLEIPKVYWVE